MPSNTQDDNLSVLDETSHGAGVGDLEEENKECEVKKLAQNETKQIWIWKVLVVMLIILTAAMVSAGSYIFLERNEEENFEDSYEQMVNTIRDASEFHAKSIFTTLRSFSATITAEAAALNQTFPFVTIPSFEALGSSVRSATGAEMINWHVLVEEDQLDDWSHYTLGNYQKNLADSRHIALMLGAEGSSIKPHDFVDGDIAPFPYIPNFQEEGIILAPKYGEGPYYPVWMTSPPIFNPNFINSDPAPWALKGPMKAVTEARASVFTDVVPVENLANRAINVDDHEAYHASLVDYVLDPDATTFMHPHSAMMVPVFEELNDPSSRMVGNFAVVLPWDRYLVNLLPDGVDGITCVLRNTCDKAWTYQLDGNSAFYMGEGDFHDPRYNYTEVELPFGEYDDDETVEGECRYSYFIYATKEYEERYRSNTPWVLTLVVAATFTLMISTFLVYDNFVKQRNNKVVDHATKTNAIVSSLFPEQVRNRLMEEEEDKNPKNKKNTTFSSGDKKKHLQVFLNGENSGEGPQLGDEGGARKTDPIADLYPECTVYFADIVGFTQWSSTRQPVDVFVLLEEIYAAFDRLAKRRRVFKVETIGDCYVAITGLPKPRQDHATAMARFASETRQKMREVTQMLGPRLGADTVGLDLRIGLHSGPVTAGVLRGEKSRFQLFGDTVNTAARMESNGQQGKIQVSEATAKRLLDAGKSEWLTKREDLINAKGKGKLQTYWVECNATNRASTTLSSSVDISSDDNSLAEDADDEGKVVAGISRAETSASSVPSFAAEVDV